MEEMEHYRVQQPLRLRVLENLLARSRVRRTALQGDIPLYALLKDLSARSPAVMVYSRIRFNRTDGILEIEGEMADPKHDGLKTLTQFTTSLSESLFFQSAKVENTEPIDEGKKLKFLIKGIVKGLSV